MAVKFQSIRGMSDLLPIDAPYWQQLETVCRQTAARYAYHEIRFPIVEPTALFKRAVGEVTDIVEKEMYTFLDRNGDSLSLRPEGTACCVRAALQSGLLHNQVQRLWYMGPMFRHERPQLGRYRQFYQFGVEAFGLASPLVEVEQLLLMQALLRELELLDRVTLEINSLGSFEARARYRDLLVNYFESHRSRLDEDSQRRLQTNPLRILDSKNPAMADLIAGAPTLLEHLDLESKAHFDCLCQLLDQMEVAYVINPTIVRGLDYYCHTVYEWTTTELGAQGTVCAGGRYDGLVEKLGGKPTPAVGFAMGLERLVLLLQGQQSRAVSVDAYLIVVGDEVQQHGLQLAEQLRAAIPSLSLEMNASGGSFKSQFKKADKSGAKYAFIIAEDELSRQQVAVKFLREDREQQHFSMSELIEFLQ